MGKLFRHIATVALAAMAFPALAENADYGGVWLNGLVRDQTVGNTRGIVQAMVCNVNGPDGFLSIRSGPGSDFDAVRKLNRLAVVKLDLSERRGRWIRVVDAYREASPQGEDVPFKSLTVQGWAHDGYLCDFVH